MPPSEKVLPETHAVQTLLVVLVHAVVCPNPAEHTVHAVHDDAPDTEYVLTGHAEHVDAPLPEKVPGEHAAHGDVPPGEEVPAGHVEHTLLVVAVQGDDSVLPPRHAVQVVHDSVPDPEYVLAGHPWHVDDPLAEYVPALHAWQVEDEGAPTAVE